MGKMVDSYMCNLSNSWNSMSRITSLGLLLLLLQLPLIAQEPSDSVFVDSEGAELEELDSIDVHVSGIPEWLTSHFSNDTLYVACDQEALPRKLVVHTNDGDVVYRLAPQFMLDTNLINHHPADSIYHHIWTDERVNPYGTLFDSLKDDIHISMAGFRLPHPGYITSPYGWRRNRMHKGTDLKVQVGDSIRSAWPGQVRIVGWDPRGYGYFVVVRHPNGLETVYGHLSRPLVDEYEMVPSGYVLGLGGNTGRSTGSHLHFEIRYGEVNIDPATVFDFEKGELLPNTERYALAPAIDSHNAIQAELSKHRFHRVRPGDTLGKIAQMYGTTVEKLCKLNKITRTSILRIGQNIQCS